MFLQNCQIKEGMIGRGRLVINIGMTLVVRNGLKRVGSRDVEGGAMLTTKTGD